MVRIDDSGHFSQHVLFVFHVNRVSFTGPFLAAEPSTEEVNVDSLLESLELKRNKSVSIPTCISSVMSTEPRILFPLFWF